MRRASTMMLCGSLLVLAACGDPGPVESGPLSVLVDGIEETDIDSGVLSEDENIAAQSGNPWGEFVNRARAECGTDPAGFSVTSVSVEITSTSNVTGFEDVVNGSMVVYFQDVSGSDQAATRVDVGTAAGPTGTGPITMTVTGSRSSLDALRARLVGGDFHLGWRAPTNKTAADDFALDVRVRLNALAHCG